MGGKRGQRERARKGTWRKGRKKRNQGVKGALEDKAIAEKLNELFALVFTLENIGVIPILEPLLPETNWKN